MKASSPIPIKNLYYLLCYAWNHFHEGQVIFVSAIDSPNLSDLLASVLASGTRHLLRRGLDRGYVASREDTPSVRGRIVFKETVQRNLPMRAQAHCEFDELTTDVLHNQILKTTILRLSQSEPLDDRLRHELRDLTRHLGGISILRLDPRAFRKVQLSRNSAFYAFLMNVCQFVQEALLPEEATGTYRFRDIMKDELKMGQVFQNFVYNFYGLEQKEFRVSSERIQWDVENAAAGAEFMLPSMLTDVTLRSKDRTLIVETKFYQQTFQYFRGSERFRSPHLYQMFAYLKNLEARGGPDGSAEGLLLYPTTSKQADFRFSIPGHKIRVSTLDLSQDWRSIRGDLLRLLE
jgi:5-methylcytosine-specific restriction enzyme subunit McrC